MRNQRTLRIGDRSASRIRTERLTPRAIEAAAEFLPRTLIESGKPFDVVAACQRLLSANAMIGVSISKVDSGNVSKVIAVGAGVFVSDEAASDIARHPVPGAVERILWSAGHGPAVPLDAQQIAAQNAHHGLNVFVVLHHQAPGLTPDDQIQVRARLTAAFLEDMRGYRLREVLADGLEDELADWAIPGGFRIRNAYDDWYRTHVEPRPRRALLGLDRNDAIALVGTVLGLLFQYQPPRLGFTASQRRVLAEAVQHKTDAEIASGLHVSHNKGQFVAADTSILPFNSRLIIPGYASGQVVQVLDKGGAIKGKKLDVFFASHDEALKWGRRIMEVIIFE